MLPRTWDHHPNGWSNSSEKREGGPVFLGDSPFVGTRFLVGLRGRWNFGSEFFFVCGFEWGCVGDVFVCIRTEGNERNLKFGLQNCIMFYII